MAIVKWMDKPTSEKKQRKNKEQEPLYLAYARYSSIAFQTGIVIGMFTWGGFELDKWLETSPIFLAVGLLLGLVIGVYLSIKDFIKKK